MESDACYPLFAQQQHFSTFGSQPYTERNLEGEPISDLELHFNKLFWEAEKGKNINPRSNYHIPAIDKSYTLLDDFEIIDNKWEGANAKPVSNSQKFSSLRQVEPKGFELYNFNDASQKCYGKASKLSTRTDSFSSEISACSYVTNDYQGSVSDYGSFKSCSVEESEWKFTEPSFNQNVQQDCSSDLWLNEKNPKDDDIFFDKNFSGRLTPDSMPEEILTPSSIEKCPLPPLETAFSKQFGRNPERNASIPQNGVTCNNLDLYFTPDETKALCIDNLDSYYNSNNLANQMPTKVDTKKAEYCKLFEKINYDDKPELDFNLNVFHEEKKGCYEKKFETDSLIEDLDSLNYYQDEDDDMIGFEEYYSPSENTCDLYDETNLAEQGSKHSEEATNGQSGKSNISLRRVTKYH